MVRHAHLAWAVGLWLVKHVMVLENAGSVMGLVKSGTCLRTPIGVRLAGERADVIRVAV